MCVCRYRMYCVGRDNFHCSPICLFFWLHESKKVNRITGRVSSKQVGEELTGELKPPASDDSDLDVMMSGTKRVLGDRSTPLARVTDAGRMWPLLCFELSVSVDQEDRLAQAHKK